MNSGLSDIQKNHPNDCVALIYFSGLSAFNTPRVSLSKNYVTMKNALFYPFGLLGSLSDQFAEERPYDSSFNPIAAGEIPNAASYTSPELGFMVAYNEFSCGKNGAIQYNGRRGATKMVIFETDGVPNTPCTGSSANANLVLGSPAAYNSYYSPITEGPFVGNNDPTVVSRALSVVQTMCSQTTASPPGYATPRTPVRVHAIGFGDLFQFSTTRTAQALSFLLQVQQIGGTSAATDTSIQSYKIITGTYQTRIDNLRLALQLIMQSGVQVSLIQ
jgi:hypothetical protein